MPDQTLNWERNHSNCAPYIKEHLRSSRLTWSPPFSCLFRRPLQKDNIRYPCQDEIVSEGDRWPLHVAGGEKRHPCPPSCSEASTAPGGDLGWAVSPTVGLLLRPLSHKNGEILGDGDSKFLPQKISVFFKEKDINKTRAILLDNGGRKPSQSKKSKLHI